MKLYNHVAVAGEVRSFWILRSVYYLYGGSVECDREGFDVLDLCGHISDYRHSILEVELDPYLALKQTAFLICKSQVRSLHSILKMSQMTRSSVRSAVYISHIDMLDLLEYQK